MKEKFKNAAEYWAALTSGHDVVEIEDVNEFWSDMDEELEEVNNQRGLYDELDEYKCYIALRLNDDKYINNNCYKIYYCCERKYYIISQLFLGIAPDNMGWGELEPLDEEERF